MVTVLIVQKTGAVVETNLKQFSIEEVCKKARVKNATDYKQTTVWSIMIDKVQYHIALYARSTGRAGQENKYEFPPPVDSDLYFGPCMLVQQNSPSDATAVTSLSEETWKKVYNHLCGGFEECLESDDDEEEEEEDEVVENADKKTGYALDGFVVGDDEEEEEDEEEEDDEDTEVEEEEDEDEEELILHDDMDEEEDDYEDDEDEDEEEEKIIPKKIKKRVRKEGPTPRAKRSTVSESYLGCDQELEEEEYFEF